MFIGSPEVSKEAQISLVITYEVGNFTDSSKKSVIVRNIAEFLKYARTFFLKD